MTFDPRVAARGGTRKNPKSSYSYPGMVDKRSWSRTEAHKATTAYGCAWCGQTFAGPHAVYTHIDKRHAGVARATGTAQERT